MDSRLIRRPTLDFVSGRSPCLLTLNASSRRQQSSYRRSKQRLNIAPDPSFLVSKDSPKQDHIIFNPPSSAPSVYHTPLKFLPKEDKRRQLLAATASKLKPSSSVLGPVLHPQKVPHHHLSEEDIAEIFRLYRKEPGEWTNTKLARKFNCSSLFISICLSRAGMDEENSVRKAEVAAQAQARRDAWGPRRRKAREDRFKRFEMAKRGD
ncbi:hypothetical protein QTJ16_005371 [Diplocarpon rosae]|uniref:Uncharacterized protein n=1 Tax=Diplocarpon rosae TaxID=946125 RepID=A0AAD9SWV4_9HELO|nr:hypothetical protein QTJ16_005371 [Diplocarpon rosae]PBP15495.1 hypothetical protein BUE80_DR013770 [Diplocarpon rosae]